MQTNTNLPIFKLVFIATLFTLSCIFTNNTIYTHIYAHTNLTTSPNLMRNSTVSKNHWKTSPHCNSPKVTQKLPTTLRSGPLRIPKSISSANAKFRLLSRSHFLQTSTKNLQRVKNQFRTSTGNQKFKGNRRSGSLIIAQQFTNVGKIFRSLSTMNRILLPHGTQMFIKSLLNLNTSLQIRKDAIFKNNKKKDKINARQFGIKSRTTLSSQPQADPALPICGIQVTIKLLEILNTSQDIRKNPRWHQKTQCIRTYARQLSTRSRLLPYFQSVHRLQIAEHPKIQVLATLFPNTLDMPAPLCWTCQHPLCWTYQPPYAGHASHLKLDLPAPPTRDMAATDVVPLWTPDFTTLAPANPHDPGPLSATADHPQTFYRNFLKDVALSRTPSIITSGPSNPHDPGPSAAVTDYTADALTHLAFFIIAIYALIDFLCTPPRSPSMLCI
jgi:hypothetical protein